MSGTRPTYAQEHILTVANGATESGTLRIEARSIVGIIVGAEFDGTAMGFSVSRDGSTWVTLTDPDTGNNVAIVAGASEAYSIDPDLLRAFDWVKLIVSAQTGVSTIYVYTMPLRA